jgi:hypothetical protein
MSPLYSTEKLSGNATQLNSAGLLVSFAGTAVLWIKDPAGNTTQNNVTCSSPNGAWTYFNANTIAGTWKWTLHVPSGTGLKASATPDVEWEVGASIAQAQ